MNKAKIKTSEFIYSKFCDRIKNSKKIAVKEFVQRFSKYRRI